MLRQTDSGLGPTYAAAENWLFVEALPLWADRGVDWSGGGFREKIEQHGEPVMGVPRRTRVVARQIYSFIAARGMGWSSPAFSRILDHGEQALFGTCLASGPLAISTYADDGSPLDTRFNLYDHAFSLFALAKLSALSDRRDRALPAAEAMLDAMESRFSHPQGGFSEDDRGGVPLGSNPHMHLLEAFLAFDEVPGASVRWRQHADRIVDLAMTRFIDPKGGFLREYFAYDWTPMPDDRGRLVEPGHQFEWSWLLHRWNDNVSDSAVETAALRLAEIGERFGVFDRVVADELWDDLTPRVRAARLWPQTERLKALIALAERTDVPGKRNILEGSAAESLATITRFLDCPTPGLWMDRLTAEGVPLPDAAPASTLYHIVCGLETCRAYLQRQL